MQDGRGSGASWWQSVPTVAAFVVGMDGVLAVAGYLFVQVTVVLAQGAVALNLVAAVLLAVLGLRLLLRRTSLCAQADRLPPRPAEALGAGLLFAVSGCPGCAPIAIGVGAAAALTGGPCWRWSPSPHSSPDAPRS